MQVVFTRNGSTMRLSKREARLIEEALLLYSDSVQDGLPEVATTVADMAYAIRNSRDDFEANRAPRILPHHKEAVKNGQ